MRGTYGYSVLGLFLLSAVFFTSAGDVTALENRAEDEDSYGTVSPGKSDADDAINPARRMNQSRGDDLYGTDESRKKVRDTPSDGRKPAPRDGPYGIGGPGKSATDDARVPVRRRERSEQNDLYETGKPGKKPEVTPSGGFGKKEGENADIYGKKVFPEQVVVINRPPSIQGLTGILITNSAFTQPAGKVALGLAFMAEDSGRPDYTILQAPATITYGLTENIELGVKGKALEIRTENVPGTKPATQRGLGDSEIMIKWRFIDQSETFPAVAIGVSGMLPTGNQNKGLNEVVHWGVKISGLASSEAPLFDDSFLGLYLEAQAVFIDELTKGGTDPDAERYGSVNIGMLFPLSEEGRLQAILEYNQLLYKNNWRTLYERNFNAVTPALRYVTERFNLSVGAQVINKEKKGWDNTVRLIGTVSYVF